MKKVKKIEDSLSNNKAIWIICLIGGVIIYIGNVCNGWESIWKTFAKKDVLLANTKSGIQAPRDVFRLNVNGASLRHNYKPAISFSQSNNTEINLNNSIIEDNMATAIEVRAK